MDPFEDEPPVGPPPRPARPPLALSLRLWLAVAALATVVGTLAAYGLANRPPADPPPAPAAQGDLGPDPCDVGPGRPLVRLTVEVQPRGRGKALVKWRVEKPLGCVCVLRFPVLDCYFHDRDEKPINPPGDIVMRFSDAFYEGREGAGEGEEVIDVPAGARYVQVYWGAIQSGTPPYELPDQPEP